MAYTLMTIHGARMQRARKTRREARLAVTAALHEPQAMLRVFGRAECRQKPIPTCVA